MGLLPRPIRLKYQTSRPKSEVINSLNEIATFKGDSFKFPFRVIGNPLTIKSKLTTGGGQVTIDENFTRVTVTIHPSKQLKFAIALYTLISFVLGVACIGFLLDGKVLFCIGLAVMALIFFTIPRIICFFAIQTRQNSIDYLILNGN